MPQGAPKNAATRWIPGRTNSARSVGAFQAFNTPAPPAGKGGDHGAAAVLSSRVDMKRPTPVAVENGAQRWGRSPVQRLEIGEKAAAQCADFASREQDPVPALQIRPDLLTLMTVNKAIESNLSHDVVTGHTLGQQELGQIARPRGDEFAVLAASGTADIHRLAAAERTVSQRQSGVLNRLLHLHADAADCAHSRGFGDGDWNILQSVRLLPIPIVQAVDFHPQRLKRRERERTVFFRS